MVELLGFQRLYRASYGGCRRAFSASRPTVCLNFDLSQNDFVIHFYDDHVTVIPLNLNFWIWILTFVIANDFYDSSCRSCCHFFSFLLNFSLDCDVVRDFDFFASSTFLDFRRQSVCHDFDFSASFRRFCCAVVLRDSDFFYGLQLVPCRCRAFFPRVPRRAAAYALPPFASVQSVYFEE